MATDAIFILEKLRCFKESDGSGHSEPYIWPVLVWVDNTTLAQPGLVGVVAPSVGSARVVIKSDMKAGDVVDIPAAVNTLRVRVEEDSSILQFMLVVALWENDDTPTGAMRAGYEAYVDEIGKAIADNLFALSTATGDDRQALIDAIKARVKSRVESAIRGGLSGAEKAEVALHLLNLDDFINADVVATSVLATQPFALRFITGSPRFTDVYAINTTLHAVPVRVDRCQSRVDAVRAAQAAVNAVKAEIADLQAQLHGEHAPGEPSLPKAFIIQEIRRLRDEDLADAQAALDAAQVALADCRRRPPQRVPAGDLIVRR